MKKILIFSTILIITILWLDFFTKSGIYWWLDTIFYPIYNFKPFFSQSIYWHIRDLIIIWFNYQVYSRFIMLLTLFIWVFLWYKLSKLIFQIFDIKNDKKKELLSIMSISFLLINPFIYERTVTQLWIALAIYLIWLWVVYLLYYLLANKRNKDLFLSSTFFWLALSVMPHTVVFLVIIFIVTLLFFYKKFSFKNIIISIFIVFLLNFNWIFWSIFLWENKTISTLKTFNSQNIVAFSSNSLDWLWVELTNLLLYWFWVEKYPKSRILLPDNHKLWIIAWFIIFWIIIFWWIKLYQKNKKLTLYLVSLAIIAYILSLWLSSNLFSWFNELLYKYIPWYIWMREPQKLTWLVMIVYSMLFVIWIYNILKWFKKKEVFKQYFVVSIIFCLLLIWSPNVLFWYNWQLSIQNYPKDIFKSVSFINKKNIEKDIILLPWHTYMECAWTNKKVISNIIPKFFQHTKFIVPTNIEVGKLYTNNPTKYDKIVKNFLKTHNFWLLKENWIKYIYVLKYCVDYYPNYIFLEKNRNTIRLFKSKFVDIYKIN